jgi:hypothetical protein
LMALRFELFRSVGRRAANDRTNGLSVSASISAFLLDLCGYRPG